MGYFEQDMLALLNIYMLESRQLMGNMEEILMNAEKQNEFSPEEIQSLFRIMHTMKSSSTMMGLTGIAETSHCLEDLFSRLRDGIDMGKERRRELFAFLLKVGDFFKEELERMESEEYRPASCEDLAGQAREFLKVLPAEKALEPAKKAVQKNGEAENGLTVLRVLFEKDCRMENIRAFMLLRQIRQVCPEAVSDPEDPEKTAGAEEKIKKSGLLVMIPPEKTKPVLEVIKKGMFVQKCELVKAALEKESNSAADPAVRPRAEKEFLNVRKERMDVVQNLTGELMLLMSAFKNQLNGTGCEKISENYFRLAGQYLNEMEDTILRMRMVPVSQIIPGLRRILRDVGKSQNKEIELRISGETVEADKNIVDKLYEASMHIIRNCADHGIEDAKERIKKGKNPQGVIGFEVFSAGGDMEVRISDDGRGIDTSQLLKRAKEKKMLAKPEKEYTREELLELCTIHGLSTNNEVTQYSGRGVGMDIVRKLAEESGGGMRIESSEGKGTTVFLHFPLTNLIVEGIRFRAGGQYFSIPSHNAVRFYEYDAASPFFKDKEGRKMPVIDLIPFYSLPDQHQKSRILIQIRSINEEAVLLVDQVDERQKIVMKPLPELFGALFQRRTGMNGCSMMGNGQLCISLDAETIIQLAKRETQERKGRYEGDGDKGVRI